MPTLIIINTEDHLSCPSSFGAICFIQYKWTWIIQKISMYTAPLSTGLVCTISQSMKQTLQIQMFHYV